ncbi:MAG: TonB-dependent receptor [Pseudomonadota bacterium]|nr:TonB-dependent receptor [Pseudomonadota bacterium]
MIKSRLTPISLAVMASATLSTLAFAQSEGGRASLEEIVVTATKRDQSLQDVPSSVSVLTSGDIQAAGIKRPNDFLASVPNVTFYEDNAGEVTINVRGQTGVRSGDPNVAIVVDGVPMVTLKAFNQDLVDIEQIEVLKGPQSAVYGRNAAAGAVVITTKDPSDVLEGSISTTLGNWDSWQVSGNVSGPITDTLKYSLAVSKRDTDGPFTGVTGIDMYAFQTQMSRLKLLWEPNEDLTVRFRVGAHDSEGAGISYNAQIAPNLDVNDLSQKYVTDIAGVLDEEMLDTVLDIEYDLDSVTLRSITGYNKFNQISAGDLIPYVPFGDPLSLGDLTQSYPTIDESMSQEFRISSNYDGNIQWMAGVYYLKFRREQRSEFNLDDGSGYTETSLGVDAGPHATVVYTAADKDTKDLAFFANMQWDITDQFRLELAGRYDEEKRSIDDFAPAGFSACLGSPALSCSDSQTFTNFSPKVSLIYLASDEITLYANYGQGYKAGGFNPIGSRQRFIATVPPGTPVYLEDTYEEEESESYELGLKGTFFDGALRLNAGIFHTVVDGAQQFEFFPLSGDQTVTSADEVELRGFDVDFQAILPGEVELFGGYGYVDGEVTKFSANPAFEGNTTPLTMEYTATLGATRDFAVGDALILTPRIEALAYGPTFWDFANTAGTERDSSELLDARLTLAGDRWSISAWGKNLTDEDYFQEYVPLAGILAVAFRAPTRSYGVDLTYRF